MPKKYKTTIELAEKLLLENKWTDSQILKTVRIRFPDKSYPRNWVSVRRWRLFDSGKIDFTMKQIPEPDGRSKKVKNKKMD